MQDFVEWSTRISEVTSFVSLFLSDYTFKLSLRINNSSVDYRGVINQDMTSSQAILSHFLKNDSFSLLKSIVLIIQNAFKNNILLFKQIFATVLLPLKTH